MTAFIPKKLAGGESWGEKLRQVRRYKDLKIAAIAKGLNIRADYLLALEEERLDRLPSGLYGKKFLSEYAAFLGLEEKEIASGLKDVGELTTGDPFSQKIVAKKKFIIFPKIVRNLLIALAVLGCLLYLILYFKKIILPPKLIITTPPENLISSSRTITVSGQTEKEAEVKINGETVLDNHDGYFSQDINLKPGLNNIVITAKKKYSREKTVLRPVLAE